MNGRIARLAALAVIAGSAAFLAACVMNRTVGHPDVRLDQWHHLYLGLFLVPVAVLRRSPLLMVVAALLVLDDGWQHVQQISGHWTYESPLHRLFAAYLWPLQPVQWLSARLNALFG